MFFLFFSFSVINQLYGRILIRRALPRIHRQQHVLQALPPNQIPGAHAHHQEHIPHVPRARQRGLRRGLRVPVPLHRPHVRVQEAREEAHQEAQGRDDGPEREANTPKGGTYFSLLSQAHSIFYRRRKNFFLSKNSFSMH